MKTNKEMVDFIKGQMNWEIEVTPNFCNSEKWFTYLFLLREFLDQDEFCNVISELKNKIGKK